VASAAAGFRELALRDVPPVTLTAEVGHRLATKRAVAYNLVVGGAEGIVGGL
jgi:hypothetical protein